MTDAPEPKDGDDELRRADALRHAAAKGKPLGLKLLLFGHDVPATDIVAAIQERAASLRTEPAE